jgi:hypothetical protein
MNNNNKEIKKIKYNVFALTHDKAAQNKAPSL